MQINKIFFIILLVFISVNIVAVSADDLNSTDIVELENDDTLELVNETAVEDTANDDISNANNGTVEKTTPVVSVNSKNVKSKDTLEIYLENSTGSPLKSKKFTAIINDKKYSLKTNSKGYSKLSINLPAKNYKLTVTFDGDDDFNPVIKVFSIKVSKLNTKITESANFIVKKNYLYFRLTDSNGDSVSGKKVRIKYNGKTYTKTTKSDGKVSIKLSSSKSKYVVRASFRGDK